jgi:hypothetical protein
MTRVAVLVALLGAASMAIAVEVGCAAAAPVVGAADPAVFGPPPAPSLYETRAPTPSASTLTPQQSDHDDRNEQHGQHGQHEHNEERP